MRRPSSLCATWQPGGCALFPQFSGVTEVNYKNSKAAGETSKPFVVSPLQWCGSQALPRRPLQPTLLPLRTRSRDALSSLQADSSRAASLEDDLEANLPFLPLKTLPFLPFCPPACSLSYFVLGRSIWGF